MTAVVFADLVGSTGLYERLGDVAASRFVTGFVGELTTAFEARQGRVVKLLGDGVFAVFARDDDALQSCLDIQRRLAGAPVIPGPGVRPVQVRMGVDSGEVVDIDGDCFGDAVNCAARLADLAGPAQILTSEAVYGGLSPVLRGQLRSLGPMYLRGKADPMGVYQAQGQSELDSDATVMGMSTLTRLRAGQVLRLALGSREVQMRAGGESCSIGRAPTNSLQADDTRVSRLHAIVEWRAGQFVLNDVSTFGTRVYVGNQVDPIVLRHTECVLIGTGRIFLGCDSAADGGAVASFSVTSLG